MVHTIYLINNDGATLVAAKANFDNAFNPLCTMFGLVYYSAEYDALASGGAVEIPAGTLVNARLGA